MLSNVSSELAEAIGRVATHLRRFVPLFIALVKVALDRAVRRLTLAVADDLVHQPVETSEHQECERHEENGIQVRRDRLVPDRDNAQSQQEQRHHHKQVRHFGTSGPMAGKRKGTGLTLEDTPF